MKYQMNLKISIAQCTLIMINVHKINDHVFMYNMSRDFNYNAIISNFMCCNTPKHTLILKIWTYFNPFQECWD
jgi:hypothetical protein